MTYPSHLQTLEQALMCCGSLRASKTLLGISSMLRWKKRELKSTEGATGEKAILIPW